MCVLFAVVAVGWEHTSYSFSESTFVGMVCVIVSNPAPTEALVFDVVLNYESAVGSAGMHVSEGEKGREGGGRDGEGGKVG